MKISAGGYHPMVFGSNVYSQGGSGSQRSNSISGYGTHSVGLNRISSASSFFTQGAYPGRNSFQPYSPQPNRGGGSASGATDHKWYQPANPIQKPYTKPGKTDGMQKPPTPAPNPTPATPGTTPSKPAPGGTGSTQEGNQTGTQSPKDEFLAYMTKSFAGKMEDRWLSAHKMTREQLNALSPDKRQDILKQMYQDIRHAVEDGAKKQPGSLFSVTA